LIFLCLWRMSLEFWYGLQWTCRLLLVVKLFHQCLFCWSATMGDHSIFFCSFIVVMGRGTLWHFTQVLTMYQICMNPPPQPFSFILPPPIPGVFYLHLLTCVYILLHGIHPPTLFPQHFPPPTVASTHLLVGLLMPSFSPIL
jgi:hypothetical protein